MLILGCAATEEAVPNDNLPDDTDGLDPEIEFEAWKLRELLRIKQDKEDLSSL